MSQEDLALPSLYRVNAEHQANCEKCGDPPNARSRQDRQANLDHRSSCVFQAVFRFLHLVGIHRFELGLFPHFSYSRRFGGAGYKRCLLHSLSACSLNERRHTKSLIEAQHSDFVRVILICVFRTIYWPIFISKNVFLVNTQFYCCLRTQVFLGLRIFRWTRTWKQPSRQITLRIFWSVRRRSLSWPVAF